MLNPANPAYIASYDAFYTQFKDPMSAFWQSLTPAQVAQLKKRGYNTVNDLWNAVKTSPMFYPPAQARSLTQAQPDFDAQTKKAVSIDTIKAAIAPKVFTGPKNVGFGFGSGIAQFHSDPHAHFSILEGQPHNNVHNNVGGFMSDFLSPVDPIFFMHHCNIDRLWDVWTRKQQQLGLPTLPTGTELTKWQSEPFLFYIGPDGKPVTAKATAGDYATIDGFDYDYGPGSGDAFVGASLAKAAPMAAQSFAGKVTKGAADSGHPAEAQVAVAAPVLEAASAASGPELFAHVTVTPPANPKGARFHVFVNPPQGQAGNPSHPSFAGTVSIFGGHAHGSVEFAVAIAPALRALRAANALKTGEPLRIHVRPERMPTTPGEPLVKSSVINVEVGVF